MEQGNNQTIPTRDGFGLPVTMDVPTKEESQRRFRAVQRQVHRVASECFSFVDAGDACALVQILVKARSFTLKPADEDGYVLKGYERGQDTEHDWNFVKASMDLDENGRLVDLSIFGDRVSSDIRRLDKLKNVCLRKCQFVPSDIQQLGMLHKLQLHHCALLSAFPLKSKSLKILDVHNYPKGCIPADLPSLEKMYVRGSPANLETWISESNLPKLRKVSVHPTDKSGSFNQIRLFLRGLKAHRLGKGHAAASVHTLQLSTDLSDEEFEELFMTLVPECAPRLSTLGLSQISWREDPTAWKVTIQGLARRILTNTANSPDLLEYMSSLTTLNLPFPWGPEDEYAEERVFFFYAQERQALLTLLTRFKRLYSIDEGYPELWALGSPKWDITSCFSGDPVSQKIKYYLKINHAGRVLLDTEADDKSESAPARKTLPLSVWPKVLERSKECPTGIFHLLRHGPALAGRKDAEGKAGAAEVVDHAVEPARASLKRPFASLSS